jgi:hypothetical protein
MRQFMTLLSPITMAVLFPQARIPTGPYNDALTDIGIFLQHMGTCYSIMQHPSLQLNVMNMYDL